MNYLSDPLKSAPRQDLIALADGLTPVPGYNATALANVRILRSEADLHDVPVLYRPGAVFVLQGAKRGLQGRQIYRYDEEHYLAVSVPVPFRMESRASPERPLLAIYVDFDLSVAAEIATALPSLPDSRMAQSLVSSRMEPDIADLLHRLLRALGNPAEIAILGPGLLRELHYRVLVGPQGGALLAALRLQGNPGRIVQSLARLRADYAESIRITDLAAEVGMSVPSYHAHFKALTGSTPLQYVKAIRLHEARLMITRQGRTIGEVAATVGYASPAQFSRDFKRHFGRTPTEEAKWVRPHLGETG